MRLGLRAQLLLALVVVTVGAVSSVGLIAILEMRQALAIDRVGRVAVWAETGGRVIELGVDAARPLGNGGNLARLPELGPAVARAIEAADVTIFDERGRALYPDQPVLLPGDAAGVAAALAGAPPHAEERAGAKDLELVAYAPIRAGYARGALRVGFAIERTVDTLLQRARNSVMLLVAGDAVLLVLVGAWILRGVVVRPVRALEAAASRVAGGDLDARVSLRGPGELGNLADAFDRMTGSLRAGRESLIRSEKLAGVGRLAAGIAHEVGNPLAAVLGYVETLLTETPERPIDPPVRLDVLERIRGETERIHKIIGELLEYARPADERVEPVSVARVVAAAVSLAGAQPRGRRASVEVRVPDGLPDVAATPGRLTQVFLNLLLNAADATGGEGRIVVDARVEGGGQVVVGFEDDGAGVAPENRARLFEPFFTTKDVGKGTGLGLSVSLAIVERWGGSIRFEETPPGTGARFAVYLAVTRAKALT